jgi:hypothetical protein
VNGSVVAFAVGVLLVVAGAVELDGVVVSFDGDVPVDGVVVSFDGEVPVLGVVVAGVVAVGVGVVFGVLGVWL